MINAHNQPTENISGHHRVGSKAPTVPSNTVSRADTVCQNIHFIAEVTILLATINYCVAQLSFDRSAIDPEPRFDKRLHIFTHHVCYQNEAVMDLTHACTTVMLFLLLLTCSAIQTNKSSSEEFD